MLFCLGQTGCQFILGVLENLGQFLVSRFLWNNNSLGHKVSGLERPLVQKSGVKGGATSFLVYKLSGVRVLR